MLAIDLDRREAWRECAAGAHMVRSNAGLSIVEVNGIACRDVDRAEREAHVALIDEIEVDKLFQRALEHIGLVDT